MLVKLINPPLQSTNGLNTDNEVSGENLPTTVVKEPTEGSYWVLDGVQISYKKQGTTGDYMIEGGLTIMDGDSVKFDVDVNQRFYTLPFYLPISPGKSLTVTLKAGGEQIIGKLNVQSHLELA